VSRALVAAAALVLAAPALAQMEGLQQSPRWGSMDLGVQAYRPNIDSEFGGTGPYEAIFGTGNGYMFTLGVSRSIFTNWGSLETGIRTGYFSKSGNSLVTDSNGNTTASGAKTALKIVPTSIALTYRFDWATERYRFPLAPYGRLAFERYNWWITKGSGGTAEKGATMGWSATGGLAFLLDFLDPDMAREFDRDSGVNHTYLFFEVQKSWIDDFGSSKSWDLSTKDLSYSAGMTFIF
jgi:hypothetical protein